jgi:hypothetical protein
MYKKYIRLCFYTLKSSYGFNELILFENYVLKFNLSGVLKSGADGCWMLASWKTENQIRELYCDKC